MKKQLLLKTEDDVLSNFKKVHEETNFLNQKEKSAAKVELCAFKNKNSRIVLGFLHSYDILLDKFHPATSVKTYFLM